MREYVKFQQKNNINLRFFFLLFSFFHSLHFTDAAPLQSLPQKPGYIPVYIRYGDTPLEEINPGLAVAFREFGGEARNFREADDKEMLADEPAPDPVSDSFESNEAKTTTKAPISEDSDSQSLENDTKEQEVPHALPVKEENVKQSA